MQKTLNWRNILEKREPYRDAFLYEKAKKTDICAVRFALKTVLSFKK
jgi:3-methyladenine DNA glycosylase Tag